MSRGHGLINRILTTIGLSTVAVTVICLFTTIPTDLFKNFTVKQNLVHSDAIVVLGSGVTQNGYPDKISLERIVKGIILYNQHYAPKIIITGGWDHDGYIAAAKAMAKVAYDLGVPKSNIIIEKKSTNTYENALYTKQIMSKNNLHSVLLVTSDSHMARSIDIFKKLNITANPAPVEEKMVKPTLSYKSKIYNFYILFQCAYEALGFIKYKYKGWI